MVPKDAADRIRRRAEGVPDACRLCCSPLGSDGNCVDPNCEGHWRRTEMPAHPQPNVQRVGERVGDHMDYILAMFKRGAKITVVVRAPGHPDRDFVQTNDDLAEAIEVLRRRLDPGVQTLTGEV